MKKKKVKKNFQCKSYRVWHFARLTQWGGGAMVGLVAVNSLRARVPRTALDFRYSLATLGSGHCCRPVAVRFSFGIPCAGLFVLFDRMRCFPALFCAGHGLNVIFYIRFCLRLPQ